MQSDGGLRVRMRLGEEVAELLRERIFSGAYPLGAPLRQEQLAEDLRVSRTPLREAIRVLEHEGLLRSAPNRTVHVISADGATLRSAYEVREMVDGLAARLAAGRAAEVDLGGLHALALRQREVAEPYDERAYQATNVAFHEEIMRLAGNPFLDGKLWLVRMTSQVFEPTAARARHAPAAMEQHDAIVAAVASGDADAAERAARVHIRSTLEQIGGRP